MTGLQFGFDPSQLYVRVDFSRRAQDVLADKGEVELNFLTPADTRLVVRPVGPTIVAVLERRSAPGHWTSVAGQAPQAAAGQILELAVAWEALGVAAGGRIACFLAVHQDGHELERHPAPPAARAHRPWRRFPGAALVGLVSLQSSADFGLRFPAQAPRIQRSKSPIPTAVGRRRARLRNPVGHPPEIATRKPSTGALSFGLSAGSDNTYYVY